MDFFVVGQDVHAFPEDIRWLFFEASWSCIGFRHGRGRVLWRDTAVRWRAVLGARGRYVVKLAPLTLCACPRNVGIRGPNSIVICSWELAFAFRGPRALPLASQGRLLWVRAVTSSSVLKAMVNHGAVKLTDQCRTKSSMSTGI